MAQKQKTILKKSSRATLASHVVTSFASVAPHVHTGRLRHHRHTSHGVLLLALLLTGVILLGNLGTLRAYGVSTHGSQTVTVSVTGAPPTVGANITYPTTDTLTTALLIEVKGTCAPETLVAIYNNGVFAGSSLCTDNGDYATIIQLALGLNTLQSQNYDALNQAGPVTKQVTITRQALPVGTAASPTAARPADITPNPSPIIAPPAVQPSQNPCHQSPSHVTSTTPFIFVSCVDRTVTTNQTLELPVSIIGGVAPYALSINWDDGVTDLKSIVDSTSHTFTHNYATARLATIALQTTDSQGRTAYLQTVIRINGASASPASPFNVITSGFTSLWTEAPVPLYWAAVMLVLGFWVGDVFQRYFAAKQPKRSTRRRHA